LTGNNGQLSKISPFPQFGKISADTLVGEAKNLDFALADDLKVLRRIPLANNYASFGKGFFPADF